MTRADYMMIALVATLVAAAVWGHRCTCGLTAIRYEVSAALEGKDD